MTVATRAVLTLLALALASGQSLAAETWPPEGATVIDRIVAIVNTEPVTKFELDRATAPFVPQILRSTEPGERKDKLESLNTEVRDGLVNDILIREEARKMRLEVSPEQVDQEVERVRRANKWSEDQLRSAVRQLGFESIAAYRKHVERELLKNQAIGIRVSSRIKIDPDEVTRVYAEEFGEGKKIEERRAAHILKKMPGVAPIKDVEAAESLLREIKAKVVAGETTFEEMARRHSDDANAAAGGDLGWFSRGELDPDFEKVAFALGEGEVSDLVRTDFGLHLIKLTGKRTKSEVDADREQALLRQIRFRLRQRELERLYKIWVKQLRADAYVEFKPL